MSTTNMVHFKNVRDAIATVKKELAESNLKQGLVGIQLPSMVHKKDYEKLIKELGYMGQSIDSDAQVLVLLPTKPTTESGENDRARRDRNDGIRYNRLYISVYWDVKPTSIIDKHDLFFDIKESMRDVFIHKPEF